MRDMTQIRYVYFDLDDTLLDHTHAERTALRSMVAELPEVFGASFETVMEHYRAINPVVWRKYSLGEYSKEQAKVGRFEQLLTHCNPEALSKAHDLAQMYLDVYALHWKAIDGAIEAFLETAATWPVGILTNGFSEVQRAKLKQFSEIEEASHTVVISEDVGHLKPSRILFDHAANKAGVDPAHILYVGDSHSSDVEGGIGAGWKVAWFSEKESDHPDVWSFTRWNDFTERIQAIRS